MSVIEMATDNFKSSGLRFQAMKESWGSGDWCVVDCETKRIMASNFTFQKARKFAEQAEALNSKAAK